MRLLIDNALSPEVARRLNSSNAFEAVHVRNLGLGTASDDVIFRYARDDERTVVSADTNFGTLLTTGLMIKPSVVLWRARTWRRPVEMAEAIAMALLQHEAAIAAGAILVIEDDRVRVRLLAPIEIP